MLRTATLIALILSGMISVRTLPAAADPTTTPAMPFLGEQPDNAKVKAGILGDIRRFAPGELDTLLKITLLCELDRATLSRRKIFDPWQKRCTMTENRWKSKYRKAAVTRMLDEQMRLYFVRRVSLIQTADKYFTGKETIELKKRQGKSIRKDVDATVELRKELSLISSETLRFFFALRDLADEAGR
ncbi:MAG: hypothetical protein GEU76_10235 [Alphaproteobacteria bacterium]|nr:hypothetical protein [Alphaproteobacteria bacterium]